MITTLLNNQLVVLLTIILIGYTIGLINICGIKLGISACLFVGIAAGAFGAELSPVITNLGIVFFIYSVGLQAGPRFFRLFGRRGLKFSLVSLFTVLSGVLTVVVLARLVNITTPMAAGIFAGAMTSTPALAGAIHVLDMYRPATSGLASVSYTLAYPFALISEIVFVQILPKFFRLKIHEERENAAREAELHSPKVKKYRLTNANIAGKTIQELGLHKFCDVNLTRYKRGEHIDLCLPNTRFELQDVVIAVGTLKELAKFKMLFGEEVSMEMPKQHGFETKDMFISGPKVVGKTLGELKLRETYGITATRLYRGDIPITPTGSVALEVGDYIRIAGHRENIDRFLKIAGSEKKRLDDTNILILSLGMLMGVLLGEIPIQMGAFTFKLGIAGGPLLVALVFSHMGNIGKLSIRIPNATKLFLRDMGLVFFLSGIGITAGRQLNSITGDYHIFTVVVIGACASLSAMLFAFFVLFAGFKLPLSQALGAMCGARTSSPALAALISTIEDDSASISFASTYPVAIISLTIFGQLIVFLGMLFLK